MFQWLGTAAGRMLLQGAAMTSTVAVFAGMHAPQTVFLDKYKEIVQSYEKGVEQPVPVKVEELFKQSMNDLKLNDVERRLVRAFTVYGFDLFHAGCTGVWTGAIIGIPINFSYESHNDVNPKITAGTKPISWQSEAGTQLKDSLVLSENARRFAITREISAVNGSSIWYYSMYPTLAFIGTYLTSKMLNDRFHLRRHPFRFIMYTLVASFSYAVNTLLTDLTTSNIESSSDEEAARISPIHAQGGVEFYKKLQQRNKALRALMGADGEKLYTSTGNDVAFIRIKTTPLSDRLLAVEEIAKTFHVVNEE